MCRIAGIWDMNPSPKAPVEAIITRMRDVLSHGGPDDAGLYLDPDAQLGFGHRRLSILDLSSAGHQPMFWNNLVIVYNGEVYNFQEVRQMLEPLGYQFHTGSDTEVILKAFECWGYSAVDKFRGMFAFAIWDKTKQELTLCRDRLGVKPLFLYLHEGLLMFASELKSFHEHPAFDKSLNHEALALYLQQGYIEAPKSIFKQVRKVMPGTFMRITAQGDVSEHRYWDLKKVYQETPLHQGSESELSTQLEQILRDSFQQRMVADVPVGVFLSGGIDSSLVTALLQQQSDKPLKTFTIGFQDEAHNEANLAKDVAKHLGTEHHELYCTKQDFKAQLGNIADFFDEPFGDSSFIPTYLVSKMARESVTVSLSADGGDEIFGGYTKYQVINNYFNKIQKLPKLVRNLGAGALSQVNPAWLERNAALIPGLKQYKQLHYKIPKLINALKSENLDDFFRRSSVYLNEAEIKQLTGTYQSASASGVKAQDQRLISYLGMLDMLSYLEGDILTKVDRSTMQVALEGREPFLDQHIVEFAMGIPDQYKINPQGSKYLLRQILYKYVPQKLIDRPKQGFAIPIKDWLLAEIPAFRSALQQDKSFFELMRLDSNTVFGMLNRFEDKNSYEHPYPIWFIYVLYQWYRRWM